MVECDKGRGSHGGERVWWGEGMREIEGRGRGGKPWRGRGSDGGGRE